LFVSKTFKNSLDITYNLPLLLIANIFFQEPRSFRDLLSNGFSPANLANSSTRQNGLFEKLVGLAKFAFIRQPGLLGLARLADICQPSFLGLARLTKAKFCK
jgi:hypothetical protein